MTAQPNLYALPAADEWTAYLDSWTIHLRARNLSPATVRNYLASVGNVAKWARAHGRPDPVALRRRDVEAWLADMADSPRSHSTTAIEYRALRVFCKWLADEEECVNPTDKTTMPKVDGKRTDVMTTDELRRILATCTGRDFVSRRDAALLRVLADTGVRLGEVVDLRVQDVDLVQGQFIVRRGKARTPRVVPFGDRTAEALGRYLRTRRLHPRAGLDALWLGHAGRGALARHGVHGVIKRRAEAAGVPNVHAHRFRHTAYDAYASAGGDGQNAMRIFGWSSERMLSHYAKGNAERRAVAEFHRLSPGDRI